MPQTFTKAESPSKFDPKAVQAPAPPIGMIIESLKTYKLASLFVVDLLGTDGTHYFIKTRQGVTELGGTEEWGTGTKSE